MHIQLLEVLLLLDIALDLCSGQKATLTHKQVKKCPVKALLGKYHLPTENLTKPALLSIFRTSKKAHISGILHFSVCIPHAFHDTLKKKTIPSLSSFEKRLSFCKTKGFVILSSISGEYSH